MRVRLEVHFLKIREKFINLPGEKVIAKAKFTAIGVQITVAIRRDVEVTCNDREAKTRVDNVLQYEGNEALTFCSSELRNQVHVKEGDRLRITGELETRNSPWDQ